MRTDTRNSGFDIMRCVAIMMVFMCHLSQKISMGALNKYLEDGMRGVQIFYVLSAYLGMVSFERHRNARTYYLKSVKRIVPEYYSILLLIIGFVYIIEGGVNIPYDNLRLGWIRYALFLNSSFPANSKFWTNLYGLWTMSSFAMLYILIPVIYKLVNSFRKSVLFLIFSFAFQLVQKFIYYIIFKTVIDYDMLSEFVGLTPFHDLYVFAVGVSVYWAIKENRQYYYIVETVLIAIAGTLLSKDHYIWIAASGLMILVFNNIDIRLGKYSMGLIRIGCKYGLAIYLSQLFAFDIATFINFDLLGYNEKGIRWVALACGVTGIISIFLVDVVDRLVDVLSRKISSYRIERD